MVRLADPQKSDAARDGSPQLAADKLTDALNHDFCPWANKYVYWLKHPLALLSIAAAIGLLVGLTQAPQGYFVFGMLTGVIVLGVAWPWIAMAGISAKLQFELERVSEGEPVDVVLLAKNRMPWPVWGLVLTGRDENGIDSHDVRFALARLPGFSDCEFRWSFIPARRGVYPRFGAQLGTAFPFGLFFRFVPVRWEGSLVVWPKTTPLDDLPAVSGSQWSRGALSNSRTGNEGDVLGTRPFRQGDLPRSVHWAQTARHGRLIVRERQAAQTHRVRVIADADPAIHWDGPEGRSIDTMFRVAGSIVRTMLSHGISVDFHIGNRLTASGVGPSAERAAFDAMARFEQGEGINDAEIELGPRGGLTYVVTTAERASATDHGAMTHRIVLTRHANEPGGPWDALAAIRVGDEALGEFRAAWSERSAHGEVAN